MAINWRLYFNEEDALDMEGIKPPPRIHNLVNYNNDSEAIPSGYKIREDGVVLSPHGKELKQVKCRPFPSVQFPHPLTGNRISYRIDKLLAMSIISRYFPVEDLQVYYIDGDRYNVDYKNLFVTIEKQDRIYAKYLNSPRRKIYMNMAWQFDVWFYYLGEIVNGKTAS